MTETIQRETDTTRFLSELFLVLPFRPIYQPNS